MDSGGSPPIGTRSTKSSSPLLALALLGFLTPAPASAANVTLMVVSARSEPRAFGGTGVVKGSPVVEYRYIINVDNTGNPAGDPIPGSGAYLSACTPADPGYPESCPWPSIRAVPGSSPIFTQGDGSDFLGGAATLALPPGRYLVSVVADGYKLDGAHFTVPADPAATVVVTVELQPHPLPTATVQAAVFEDDAMPNGAPDVPAERGLAGFEGHIADYLGEVTTDVYGNPLCTEYARDRRTGEILLDAEGLPTPLAGTGGRCVSKCYDDAGNVVPPADALGRCPVGALGILKIPNLGPNRYATSAIRPAGTQWVQTTTLEGNLDWDTWVMEGGTGLDTEFVQAGEPFPWTIFGYVLPKSLPSPAPDGGTVTGVVVATKVYIPAQGGLPTPGSVWGGLSGAKIDQPVAYPWIALADLQNGDRTVYVGRGGADGRFTVSGVAPGNYTLTYWDENLFYILDLVQITVGPNEEVDVGWLPLTGWFTKVEGHVFSDLNRNGKMDAGEPGIANYPVALKRRENSVMDRGATVVTTDPSGHYVMENAYPLTQWLVLEAYTDSFYTTGITFQADNQPSETTVLGSGVDVGVLPIIGLGGRLDWGVHAYDPTGRNGVDPRNGGIVGTVSYDTTRNELDPRYAAIEPWQPGVPGLTVKLWAPVFCGTHAGAPCDAAGGYELTPDGAYAKGRLLNVTVTETWERPRGCVARDVDGEPLVGSEMLPSGGDHECLEGPLMGVQFQAGFATVDGNYGFTDGCLSTGFDEATGACAPGDLGDVAPEALTAGDYLVEVVVPEDPSGLGRPLYRFTREEDINIFDGDAFVPQIPPPACAGPLHLVDVAGVGTDGQPALVGTGANGVPVGVTVPASTPVVNPAFADGGGSAYEGQARPLCNAKLVTVSNGRSVAPGFNVFTEVPIPGRFMAYVINDLAFSTDPKSLLWGEKAGTPHLPVGIYDYTNRLVHTVETDYNGVFDVLLPSTGRINCPTPSGVCANMYRLVGNDPGVPGQLNASYTPQYRTISAIFEVFPGIIIPADLAPTQVGVNVQLPGAQTNQLVTCPVDPATPQLLTVTRPWVAASATAAARTITIAGLGFGAAQGAGAVTLDGTLVMPTSAWSATEITFTVPATTPPGPHQLAITADNGRRTVNGLTVHVIGPGYNPRVFEVGPGRAYSTIQSAIDAGTGAGGRGALVVVYPGQPSAFDNPRGAYFENLIITSPVKLQGVGPGGFQDATHYVHGSIVDGGAFGGDGPLADAWRAKIATLTWSGNQDVYEGATVYLLARSNGGTRFGSTFKASIDGLTLRGGDQAGFPNNLNQIGGTPTGLPPTAVTQGGGIFANAWVQYLQITNNVLEANGGAYGGAIRLGTPNLPAPDTDNRNYGVRIANNRIVANAGTNLAGGVGLFAGSNDFEVAYNDVCGNFSAEYGGGISVYGFSPNGRIHHNRIYFNQSYDEGGGIMIAGELPADPGALSPGTGPVAIYANLIQANLSNDDGGGIRFLMAGNFPMEVYDNFIVNNVSTHEGGGVSLNDSPNVRIYNNTVMRNLTTATALTSNGMPAPAGISTSLNSALLQVLLPADAPAFSDPVLFNNVFWDNRAGARAGGTSIGLGLPGDPTPVNLWDVGVSDGSGLLSPTYSILQTPYGAYPHASNQVGDAVDGSALVLQPYPSSVSFAPWRTNPNFVGAVIAVQDLSPDLGDYHLTSTSAALDAGVGAQPSRLPPSPVAAPTLDVDGEPRPLGLAVDIGADERP